MGTKHHQGILLLRCILIMLIMPVREGALGLLRPLNIPVMRSWMVEHYLCNQGRCQNILREGALFDHSLTWHFYVHTASSKHVAFLYPLLSSSTNRHHRWNECPYNGGRKRRRETKLVTGRLSEIFQQKKCPKTC